MKILGVECSAVSAGAAVVCDGVLVSESFTDSGLTHSETLMPLIDNVLCMAKINIDNIDLIAISDGPGSFTGLRIGVGTVKGLALGADKKVCGISPLLALCYNVAYVPGIISPMMDARRGEVYNALYRWEGGFLREISPMRAIPVDQLAAELPEGATFVGDGARVHQNKLRELLGGKALFAPAHLTLQRASSIAMAAMGQSGVSPAELLPVYIRKPQAERELEEKVLKSQIN